ncbi:MAG TPA: hypothetical protein VF648_07715 [Pyrinomonadaceae bacterium]
MLCFYRVSGSLILAVSFKARCSGVKISASRERRLNRIAIFSIVARATPIRFQLSVR